MGSLMHLVNWHRNPGEPKADGDSVVHTPMMAALTTNIVFLWSRNEASTVARMARSPLGYCFINLTTLSIHVKGDVNWKIDGVCLIRHHYASSEMVLIIQHLYSEHHRSGIYAWDDHCPRLAAVWYAHIFQ